MPESALHTANAASESWLEVIDSDSSDSSVLLITPHGGRAEPRTRSIPNPKVNDLHTADITRGLAARLGASALINVAMDRNRLDCNHLSQIIERAPGRRNRRAPWPRHGAAHPRMKHYRAAPRFRTRTAKFRRRTAAAGFRLRLGQRRFHQRPSRRTRRPPASSWNQADLWHALPGRRPPA